MNNKLESFKKLREVIENTETLAKSTYYECGCNCVVGHLLKLDGITDDQLKELDDNKYSYGDYNIDSIMEFSNENTVEDDFVKTSLENLGFDMEEDQRLLKNLQQINDNKSKAAVLEELDTIITQLETREEE